LSDHYIIIIFQSVASDSQFDFTKKLKFVHFTPMNDFDVVGLMNLNRE